ncbi:MAG TPA: LysE family transporter [Kofleriaceae bacterium]|nr:LysE family transporter [Kofleriaceae bacterium]
MLAHALLGFALGVVTSLPPGPCGLAIVMTIARRESMRRALATAAGGALGDVVYSSLGILGIGAVFATHPAIPLVMQLASGVAMIGYGALQLDGRTDVAVDVRSPRGDSVVHGAAVGLGCVLANPAALLAWVVVVAGAIGAPGPAAGCATVAGIGAGTFTWFAIVAHLVRAGRRRNIAHVGTIASGLVVGGGVLAIARATFALGAR